MTDEPTSPTRTPSIAQLTARLCEVEAARSVLGTMGAELRAAIRDRAVERWRADGAAPTYRVPSLGSVSLPIPQPKVVVDDQAAFASWVADHYPHQVTCVVTISEIAPDYLGETIDKAREIAPTDVVRGGVVPAPAFVKGLLDNATVAEGLALAAGTGDVIDGVKVVAGADPANAAGPQPDGVTVRLDPQAKADAEAQAAARLADIIDRDLTVTAGDLVDDDAPPPTTGELRDAGLPGLAALADADPPADAPAVYDVDDAVGEPDDDPICECRHAHPDHRGKAHGGACMICPTGGCQRFRVAANAWTAAR